MSCATFEVHDVHVACPQCGTGYTLKPEMLERERLRLRCRHCRHVWDPRHPLGEPAAAPPAATTSASAASAASSEDDELADAVARALEREPPEASAPAEPTTWRDTSAGAAAPQPSRRRLAAMLYALAAVLALASLAGLGWAYRDGLPFASAPLPELRDVRPAWRADDDGRRLVVSAEIANPGTEATEIRRVRVKFLSEQGAWIDETVVEVPTVTVPAGATGSTEMAVDRLPEGTSSLELSLVPEEPVS